MLFKRNKENDSDDIHTLKERIKELENKIKEYEDKISQYDELDNNDQYEAESNYSKRSLEDMLNEINEQIVNSKSLNEIELLKVKKKFIEDQIKKQKWQINAMKMREAKKKYDVEREIITESLGSISQDTIPQIQKAIEDLPGPIKSMISKYLQKYGIPSLEEIQKNPGIIIELLQSFAKKKSNPNNEQKEIEPKESKEPRVYQDNEDNRAVYEFN